jgi:hypothetical protein
MLRDNKKKGLNCRTKRHIEVKMHLGRGTFCCSTLNPCYIQLSECVPKTSRDVLRMGKMKFVVHSCIRIYLLKWF